MEIDNIVLKNENFNKTIDKNEKVESPLRKLDENTPDIPKQDNETVSTQLVDGDTKPFIGTSDECPEYLRDNEYILGGYRIGFNSYSKVFRSLFILHNESVNVWSHLLGFFVAIFFIFYTIFFIHHHTGIVKDIRQGGINSDFENSTNLISDQMSLIGNMTYKIGSAYGNTEAEILNYVGLLKNKSITLWNRLGSKVSTYTHYFTGKHKCEKCKQEIIDKYQGIKSEFIKDIDHIKNTLNTKSKDIYNSFIMTKDAVLDYIDTKEADWINYKSFIGNNKFDHSNEDSEDPKVRKFPIFSLLFGGIVCLGCSTVFHLLHCMNPQAFQFLNRLDYAGISILVAGSCYPPYYYFFFCSTYLMIFYLSFITIFAVGVFVYSFNPSFNTPEKRKLRGALFLTLGISAGVPMFHLALFPSSIQGFSVVPSVNLWIIGGASYIIGALIYIARVPERLFKNGWFDNFGHSHQIFHFGVLGGVAVHYAGALDAYYYRVVNQC